MTEEEVSKVNNNTDKIFGLFPYFLLYTGLRKGEALALQYKDIDLIHNIIKVDKSVYYIDCKPRVKSPKTVAGKRNVILLECLKNRLPKGNPNDYVFCYPGDSQRMMTDDMFRRLWRKYVNETGLAGVTAHMLRHSYATILFEAGIEAKDAQALMGHSDISTTNNIYTHIREKRMLDTAEKLNKFANTL